MRRMLAFLLAFLLLINLSGCVEQPTKELQKPTSPSITVPTDPIFETPQQIPQQQMIATSMPIVTQEYEAENGQPLLQHIYQNLELIVPDQDVADTVIIDYLSRMDAYQATVESLFTEATTALQNSNLNDAFLYQTIFSPQRLDRSVFSLSVNIVTHRGYSHPEVNADSVTYDLATGKPLTISDILQSDANTQTLLSSILTSLQEQESTISFYENYTAIVTELFETPNNWYFSESGLVFYYSPYEIAPYSSGVITAEIKYSELVNILNDAYFPAESDNYSGTLLVSPFDVGSVDQFTQIAEVVSINSRKQIILYTDGLLENLRIEQMINQTAYPVFASQCISPGDGIAIHCSDSDIYKIHYHVDGKEFSKTLQFSTDGEPQLTD